MRIALALSIGLLGQVASADINSARYTQPTDAYGHGALPGGEYASLEVSLSEGATVSWSWPGFVFEDYAPRLVDLDGDGSPEVLTVASGFEVGAALWVFDEVAKTDGSAGSTMRLVGQSAPIGQRQRWLSVIGTGDFDDNGKADIAYVDRPHLAKRLTIVEVDSDANPWALRVVSTAEGHTNHRYGTVENHSGVADCDGDMRIVTVSSDWQTVLESQFEGGQIITREIGPFAGAESISSALECE